MDHGTRRCCCCLRIVIVDAPALRIIAVEVHAEATVAIIASVLPPHAAATWIRGRVVHVAIGIDAWHEAEFEVVEHVGGFCIGAVILEQVPHEEDELRKAYRLTRVMQRGVEQLGLVLVHIGIVAHAHQVDRPSLVRGTDAVLLRDRLRICRAHGIELGLHLFPREIAAHAAEREVLRRGVVWHGVARLPAARCDAGSSSARSR